MYDLRKYQHEAVKVMRGTKKHNPSLIALPTGSGKSVIFASFISQVKGRVLVVVPNGELRDQSLKKIQALSPDIDVGMVQSNLFDSVHSRIVIATRQSLTSKKSTRIHRMLSFGKFAFVIFDETHQAMLQIQEIIKKLNKDCKVIGMTASPWNPEMLQVFQRIDYSKSIVDMIDLKYLCEPLAYRIRSKTDLNDVRLVGGEFNQKDLEEAVNNEERNELVVESYKKYCQNRLSVLVFASGIQHINDLVKEFNENGIYAKGLHSKHDKVYRDDVIAEFSSGKLPVLVNCGILTTGYDYERLDALLLARPTKSRILYTQCIGRGLRIHPEKENCLIIDIVDISRKHDLIDMNTLFEVELENGETIEDARKRKAKKEKDELEAEEKRQQEILLEEERRRIKIEEMQLEAERVDLLARKVKETFNNDRYDWIRVDNITFALSYNGENHIVVEKMNDKYTIYDVCTAKNTQSVKTLETLNSQDEAMKYTYDRLAFSNSSHLHKDAAWKSDPATDRQKNFCYHAKTKWDAHKYFASYNIEKLLKSKK